MVAEFLRAISTCIRMVEGVSVGVALLPTTQWSLIARMLPGPTGRAGRPFSGARHMIEAIIYRDRCGIEWRDLPEVFVAGGQDGHRRMASDGTWDAVLEWMIAAAGASGALEWSISVVDSAIARAHRHATNFTGTRGAELQECGHRVADTRWPLTAACRSRSTLRHHRLPQPQRRRTPVLPSNNGADGPHATTNSPAPTEPPPSSTRLSPGPSICQTRPSLDVS